MKMKHLKKYSLVLAIAVVVFMQSCQQAGGDTTGSEYMPDMAHSIAYEANYYNYYYIIPGVARKITMPMLRLESLWMVLYLGPRQA